MACCCSGADDDDYEQGGYGEEPRRLIHEPHIVPYRDRKTRDILCLLIYILFWIGMLMIAGVSFALGDPRRILYGLDGYGNTCGAINNWNDTSGPDLTAKTKLYYLSPFDLLNPVNFLFGKSICVESCPIGVDPCGFTNLPCDDAGSFRCPYYQVAEDSIHGTLEGVEDDWSTNYWDELITSSILQCDNKVTDSTLDAVLSFAPGNATRADLGLGGFTSWSTCGEEFQKSSSLAQGPCYPVMVNTTDIFNRCMPQFDEDLLEAVADTTSGAIWDVLQSIWDATRLERFFVDVLRSWPVILAVGVVVAIVFAVVWLIMLRFFGGVMVVLTIILINAALVVSSLVCFSLAGKLGKAGQPGEWLEDQLPPELGPADKDQKVWEWLAWIAVVLEVVVLLVSIAIATKIRIAIAIIKVAIESIGTIPSLLVFPFLPMLAEAILICAWVIVGAFMWSCGEVVAVRNGVISSAISNSFLDIVSQTAGKVFDGAEGLLSQMNTTVEDFEYPDVVAGKADFAACALQSDCRYELRWPKPFWYMAAYHVFGLLWATQFIAGCTTVVVSGSVANFYWNRGTRGGRNNNKSPLLWALGTTFCCHLGSIALGSFVVAVVFFVRVILEYIHRKSKTVAKETIFGAVLNCLRCCVWCFEKFLEFINRNTLIMVGVKGKGYCASASRATALMLSNVLRVAVVNTVSAFLMWIGKLLVMVSCGMLTFIICDLPFFRDPVTYPDLFLSSKIVPVVATVVVSYLIADVYFQVYDVVVDTILLAFCEDCEQNDGAPRYAPEMLLQAIGENIHRKPRGSHDEALGIVPILPAAGNTGRHGARGSDPGMGARLGNGAMGSPQQQQGIQMVPPGRARTTRA